MNNPCEKCGGDHAVWNCNMKITRNDTITRRDYFAGLALQGIMISGKWNFHNATVAAETAVECADALIKELDKK